MTTEKFTKQQIPDYPAVTIRKNGTLCINSIATQQLFFGGGIGKDELLL